MKTNKKKVIFAQNSDHMMPYTYIYIYELQFVYTFYFIYEINGRMDIAKSIHNEILNQTLTRKHMLFHEKILMF